MKKAFASCGYSALYAVVSATASVKVIAAPVFGESGPPVSDLSVILSFIDYVPKIALSKNITVRYFTYFLFKYLRDVVNQNKESDPFRTTFLKKQIDCVGLIKENRHDDRKQRAAKYAKANFFIQFPQFVDVSHYVLIKIKSYEWLN